MAWLREKLEVLAFAVVAIWLIPIFALIGIVLAILSPFIRTKKTTRDHYFKL